MADTITWFIQDYWMYFILIAGTLVFSGARPVLMAISHKLLKTLGIRSNYSSKTGRLEVDHSDFSSGEVQRIKEVASSGAQNVGSYQVHSKVKVKPLTKAEKKKRKNNKKGNDEELQ